MTAQNKMKVSVWTHSMLSLLVLGTLLTVARGDGLFWVSLMGLAVGLVGIFSSLRTRIGSDELLTSLSLERFDRKRDRRAA